MKQVFTGTLEVRSVDRGMQQGTKGRIYLTVPEAALDSAGLMCGKQPVRLSVKASGGRVVVRASVTRGSAVEANSSGYTVLVHGQNTGISARTMPPVRVALVVQPGSVELLAPDEALAKPRKPTSLLREREERGTFRDATAGLYGAAYAMALDDYRNETKREGGARQAVCIEQLADMLRNAGHRVVRISARLWTLDGESATLGDLSEAARRIDRDAVLVAEAA